MNEGLKVLIDATRYLQQRGSSENDALQLLDNAMVRVRREPEMPHALDGTCWCLREPKPHAARCVVCSAIEGEEHRPGCLYARSPLADGWDALTKVSR